MSALAEQHERWVGVRQRLWNPPQRHRVSPRLTLVVQEPKPLPPKVRWHYPPVAPYDHFAPLGDPNQIRRKTMKEIIREVASKHKMTVAEIKSARRTKAVVCARHEAIWRCKMETPNSLPAIGRAFGGFDHTTCLHAIKRHEQRMREAANASN